MDNLSGFEETSASSRLGGEETELGSKRKYEEG